MVQERRDASGVSELVGTILIILLVIALVAIFFAIMTGLVSLQGKTAYIVPKAELKNFTLPGGKSQVIVLSNLGGDISSLNTSLQAAAYELGVYVDTPASSIRANPAVVSEDLLFNPGETLFIFRTPSGYYTSKNSSHIPAGSTIPTGDLSLRLIDETNHVLVSLIVLSGTGATSVPSTTLPVTTTTVLTTTAATTTTPTTTIMTSPTTTVTTMPTTAATTTSLTTTPTTMVTTSPTTTATTVPTTTPSGLLRSISGMKWHDTNGNGIHDSGETGLSGWTIRLMISNGPGGPYSSYRTTTTASDGSYTFNSLDNGKYYEVTEVIQSGWSQTYPSNGYYTDLHITNSYFTGMNFGNR